MKKRENPVIQRVSDPFDDLVMDSNKSLKSIYKGSRRNGVRMAKRKKGMTFIPYDYEAAYNKSLEDMHEFFVEQMFKQGKKVVYALKEIRAGDQFEVEIYPQFKKMDEVPPEGRSIKKDNDKAQRNLNDKNARKYVERLINENFTDRDLWLTFTYDNEHLPPDGDIDAAIKNVQKFIRRVNYQRKKRGLPNARYVYVTAYNPTEEIRWHHHIVMDGDMDMDVVEGCWKQSSRNEVRRLQKDENGLTGMAKYIVEEKNRVKSEKRWNSSQGLRDPDIKVVHSKRPTAKAGGYKKIGTYVETMKEWREVFGTEAEQPEEFDTTASPTTVYQRRNIKKATKEDADGKKITGWQREEREMSREEYDRLTLMQEVVASNTTGIVESVTQFQKDAVIDEYTQQLIEEGLI